MIMKKYICNSDYEGAFIGTLMEIIEWQAENNIPLAGCEYYEVGKPVKPSELFKDE